MSNSFQLNDVYCCCCIPRVKMSSVDDDNSSTSTSSSSVTVVRPILRASMLRPSAFPSSVIPIPPASTHPDGQSVGEEGVQSEERSPASAAASEERAKPAADPLAMVTKSNGLAKSNPFTAVQVTPLSSASGFVFGQNTRDRVTGNVEKEDGGEGGGGGGAAGGAMDDTSTSSTAAGGAQETNGDLLFAAVPGSTDPAKTEGGPEDGRSLSDVAREYEESKSARKRKFEEVETFTGEEDEINVLDVTCKLYTFATVYEERGRGSLRLNDPKKDTENGPGVSRLVFRAAGSLRLLLNTKIWAGMIAEPASPKSLRLTAIDTTGQVKVYLVQARPSDIQSLAMALKMRISMEKARVAEEAKAGNGEDQVGAEQWDTNGDDAEKLTNVTPDLIADTEKAVEHVVLEDDDDESKDVASLIVEEPASKRQAIEKEVGEMKDDTTNITEAKPQPTPAAETEGSAAD